MAFLAEYWLPALLVVIWLVIKGLQIRDQRTCQHGRWATRRTCIYCGKEDR
jgi:hypothetical protein